ncbi:hypothetical protein FA15DRAFT_758748 [Coprinopsis marcescibilis]|uniref:Uncharacterized protein n=1 Tax=Coprinopsis marcescibilis TaxID=230819 RepID=A0A5C3KM07_COPMA|nr:hypothetical protein FA15DRAFT_758748 [Coprinopsis marcescibilis]
MSTTSKGKAAHQHYGKMADVVLIDQHQQVEHTPSLERCLVHTPHIPHTSKGWSHRHTERKSQTSLTVGYKMRAAILFAFTVLLLSLQVLSAPIALKTRQISTSYDGPLSRREILEGILEEYIQRRDLEDISEDLGARQIKLDAPKRGGVITRVWNGVKNFVKKPWDAMGRRRYQKYQQGGAGWTPGY